MNPAVLSGQTSIPVTFMASVLIWIMFAGLLVLWLIDGRIKKEVALHALFSAVFAWIFSEMIKSLFPTIRPFEINGSIPMTLTIPTDGAFPSGHTASAFGLATSVWLHNKRLGTIFIICATLVGIGRILGNVHYRIDIIGGAFLGILTSYLTERLHVYKLLK